MTRRTNAKVTSITAPVGTIEDLLDDWERHLGSRNVADTTVHTYKKSALKLAAFLKERKLNQDAGSVTRKTLEAFFADQFKQGGSASYVAKHYRQVQQFFRWLADDGEIPHSPMIGMSPPAIPEQPVPIIPDDRITKLLEVCKGATFENRRDAAIIRLFLDTGLRVAEVANLPVKLGELGIDFDQDVAYVLGKGRRIRAVAFGPRAADALRKYARARGRHPQQGLPFFWLGRKGQLSVSGIAQMLERRCTEAGIPRIHPHQFRHTFAHHWLNDGGQEQDLMRMGGWRSRQMIGRYGASAADERAMQAARRLHLGERF